ncbi:uncharacterized protein LOC127081826 [Lathyrus oleraceus]|uniref:uncharacterized protein LOC127081826 n=1 Tax=Pisum sativum TaxID=3888 RepID=UPI0021D219C1|nr:uncharacterized protein LOC127081826 [Pisum sativum]
MVDHCPGNYRVFDVRHIRKSLVEIHRTLCLINDCEHDHNGYVICSVNPRGYVIIKRDIQKLVDEGVIHSQHYRDIGNDVNVIFQVFKTPEQVVIQFNSNKNDNRFVSPLVIRLAGPIPYASDKIITYKYNATMIDNGQEVPLLAANSVVSIANVVKVTRSGRLFGPVSQKVVEDVLIGKKVDVPLVDPVNVPTFQSGESSGLKVKDDDNDEVLGLIKNSKFNVVEQLIQTSSKISVLSLLMNSKAHREALKKVLEQAYVEHDVIVDQFNHIVANITSCNHLSFCDEELPEEGRNHNLALHISMNSKKDDIYNVLVDTVSSLNVLPKSTLARLSYQGTPMKHNDMVVKAFNGSHKTVIREVDLPVKIGPSDFQITFQVTDIHPAYSYLLGRLWIHEAVLSRQLCIRSLNLLKMKIGASMSSLKDAREVVQVGGTDKWGRIVEVVENKNIDGLAFQQGSFKSNVKAMQSIFCSGGFIHKEEEHSIAIIEDEDEDDANFVTHRQTYNNWVVVDVPIVVHRSN